MLSPILIIDSVNVDAKLYSYPFRCVCIFEIRKLENKVRHTVGSKGRTSGIYPCFNVKAPQELGASHLRKPVNALTHGAN